ncbi:MAG: VWA domain-containing protein [Planctomycetes bacterium]|nr:VWA domain-containing protein [Planctomycetota bacterium]
MRQTRWWPGVAGLVLSLAAGPACAGQAPNRGAAEAAPATEDATPGLVGRRMVNDARRIRAASENAWTMRADGTVPVGRLNAQVPGQDAPAVLGLRDLEVCTLIEGLAARTTVTHVFSNQTDATLEGVFTFSLPADAAVDRFAMTIFSEHDLMEASLVEAGRARSAYEQIVYGSPMVVDPGLLEWVDAHTFRATIFPIPAQGTKTIVLSYVQMLTQTARPDGSLEVRYRHPFSAAGAEGPQALPASRVALRAHVHGWPKGTQVSASHGAKAEPGVFGDLRLGADLAQGAATDAWSLTLVAPAGEARECAVQAYRPIGSEPGRFALTLTPRTAAADEPVDVLFLVDTSASRKGAELDAHTALIEAALKGLRSDDRFAVLSYDVHARACPGGWQAPTLTSIQAAVEWLSAIHPLGATDVAGALRTAAQEFVPGARGRARIVLLGDTEATYGERTPDALRKEMLALQDALKAEWIAICPGIGGTESSTRGEAWRKLAEVTNGPVLNLGAEGDPVALGRTVAERLRLPVLRDVSIVVSQLGGTECSLAEPALPGRWANVSTTLYGSYVQAGTATVRLDGTLDGLAYSKEWQVELPATETANRAAGRLWARARLNALTGAESETKAEALRVALEQHVLSPLTAFLVLESERMFQDFNIARPDAEQKRTDMAGRTLMGGVRAAPALEIGVAANRRVFAAQPIPPLPNGMHGSALNGPVDVGGVRVILGLQKIEVAQRQEPNGRPLTDFERFERRLKLTRMLASARGLPFEPETVLPQKWLQPAMFSGEGLERMIHRYQGAGDSFIWSALSRQPSAAPETWRGAWEAAPADEQNLARLADPRDRSRLNLDERDESLTLRSNEFAHYLLAAISNAGAYPIPEASELQRLLKTVRERVYDLRTIPAESKIAAYNFLAELMLSEGQTKAALACAERALAGEKVLRSANDPRPARLSHLLKALAHHLRTEYPQAAAEYRALLDGGAAVAAEHRDAVYWALLVAMVQGGDKDGGIAVLERWCKESLYRKELCEELGKGYLMVERVDDAIRAFSTRAEFDPKLGEAVASPAGFLPGQ